MNASTAIIGGSPSDASQDFVVVIANVTDADGLECNANLVAPNLLVTARHCVAVLDKTHPLACNVAGGTGGSPTVTGDYAPSHFEIAKDENLTESLGVHATAVIDSGATTLCGEDIAFLVLDNDVAGLPIAPLSASPVTVGDVVTVVGSGQIDDAGTQAPGRMQRGDVSVLGVGPTAVAGPSEKVSVLDGEFATTTAFCYGDSGGPALDGRGFVTGLVSRTPSCSGGPDVFTSVAAHLDVVQQAFDAAGVPFVPGGADAGADAGDATETGDVEDVATASSGCAVGARDGRGTSSASAVALALAALAVARARRRRAQ